MCMQVLPLNPKHNKAMKKCSQKPWADSIRSPFIAAAQCLQFAQTGNSPRTNSIFIH